LKSKNMSKEASGLISSFLKETNPQLFEAKKINELLKEKKDLLFLEIDIEEHPLLAQELNITSIPACFLFFREEVAKGPQLGRMDLSQLEEFVKI
ncbi:27034_t:CDS:2, partial [Racocetra persica]